MTQLVQQGHFSQNDIFHKIRDINKRELERDGKREKSRGKCVDSVNERDGEGETGIDREREGKIGKEREGLS